MASLENLNAAFPLTLTLFLTEREERFASLCFSNAALTESAFRLVKRLKTIPPLPEGEGKANSKVSKARSLSRTTSFRIP